MRRASSPWSPTSSQARALSKWAEGRVIHAHLIAAATHQAQISLGDETPRPPKRDQNFSQKGYYLEAREVKDDGSFDDSFEGKEIFGNDCHEIIHERENPQQRFQHSDG